MSEHLLLEALRREPAERYPVWIMRQAGRSMAVFREMRKTMSFLDMVKNPEIAAKVTLQPVDGHGVDAAIIFSDILFILDGFNMGLDFRPGPVLERPIRNAADVDAMPDFDIDSSCGFIPKAIARAKELLAGRVPLIGFVGAPQTLAVYALGDGKQAGMKNLERFAVEEPGALEALLDLLSRACADVLIEQSKAGADVLMVFDTWAAALGAEGFERFAAPYARRVVELARAEDKPIIYMSRETKKIIGSLSMIGADCYTIDWTVTPEEARSALGEGPALMGNLDPEVLLGDADSITSAAEALLEKGVFDVPSLGHGVLRNAPEENVTHFVKTIQNYPGRPVGRR